MFLRLVRLHIHKVVTQNEKQIKTKPTNDDDSPYTSTLQAKRRKNKREEETIRQKLHYGIYVHNEKRRTKNETTVSHC